MGQGKLEHSLDANRLVSQATDMASTCIRVLPIPPETLQCVALSDASWANAASNCRQAGFLVAACDPLLVQAHCGGFLVRWKIFKQDRQTHGRRAFEWSMLGSFNLE